MEGLVMIILYLRLGKGSHVNISHPVALVLVLILFFLVILVYIGVFDGVFQALIIENQLIL